MKQYVRVSRACQYLNLSPASVRRICDEGQIDFYWSGGNGNGHRMISVRSLRQFNGEEESEAERLAVGYARCSTSSQRDSLNGQCEELKSWARKNVVGKISFAQ